MGQYQIDSRDRRVYPMGLSHIEGGIHISVAAAAKECYFLLFLPKREKESHRIPFPEQGRMGDVWEMTLRGSDFERYEYAFEADGVRFSDPCGCAFCGRERWGRSEQVHTLLRTPIGIPEFDWEEDAPPHIPYEESVIYRAHVRGLTRHASSGVASRGTFAGVVEKIPYLKELGITTLELLPVAEFQEIMMPEYTDGNPYGKPEPTGKINYWGYAPAFLYAPKASYAGKGNHPVTELKTLVKALHRTGMELVIELYFTGKETPEQVLFVARHWVREYHVDGIHLVGQVNGELLAKDPYLADVKLWARSWEQFAENQAERTASRQKLRRHLAEYREDFQNDMRKILKGDEDQMRALTYQTRRNPKSYGVIHYLDNTNGFTLMDLVSYDQKHNEANGEQNRDGNDYNFSWNCGVEGPVRKKKIAELRKKQWRNAVLLLFLSQGTPLILAGDEFGNSQNGNNNAYCQDNEISWLNWKQQETNHELFAFMKQVIAFRKEHPIFHLSEEPRVMDYLSCGHPDVSYHGQNAWQPEFENFRRQLGILYCGKYAKRNDGTPDDYFYVAYNMHWEPHEFALPNLPHGLEWKVVFDTSDSAENGYYVRGSERILEDQKQYRVPPRTIVVLMGGKTTKILDKEKQRSYK